MKILALNGIPIPRKFQNDGKLLQAYLQGYKDGKASNGPTKPFRTFKTVVNTRPAVPESEIRRVARKYKLDGPVGTHDRPKQPWEMSPAELEAEKKRQADWEELGFTNYVPDLPRVFGPPPPPQKGGSIHSFDDDARGQIDLVSHMTRIRRRVHCFIPPSAFKR